MFPNFYLLGLPTTLLNFPTTLVLGGASRGVSWHIRRCISDPSLLDFEYSFNGMRWVSPGPVIFTEPTRVDVRNDSLAFKDPFRGNIAQPIPKSFQYGPVWSPLLGPVFLYEEEVYISIFIQSRFVLRPTMEEWREVDPLNLESLGRTFGTKMRTWLEEHSVGPLFFKNPFKPRLISAE